MSISTDIEQTYDLLKSLPPMAVAIWCIDRPAWYARLKDLLPQGKGSLYGINIYNWSSKEMLERMIELQDAGWTAERIARCYPFLSPGVYVEMNKGPHLKLDEES